MKFCSIEWRCSIWLAPSTFSLAMSSHTSHPLVIRLTGWSYIRWRIRQSCYMAYRASFVPQDEPEEVVERDRPSDLLLPYIVMASNHGCNQHDERSNPRTSRTNSLNEFGDIHIVQEKSTCMPRALFSQLCRWGGEQNTAEQCFVPMSMVNWWHC